MELKRGTIFLVLFIIISVGVIGFSRYLRSRPPLQVTIAVDPLAEPWVRALAREFNASEPMVGNSRRIELLVGSGNMTVIDDVDLWGLRDWPGNTHPDIWIPASSASVTYTQLPFDVLAPSSARTPLIFAGYADRVAILTRINTEALDWSQIINAANVQSWQVIGDPNAGTSDFFTIAFGLPENTIDGAATLFSAAAALADTTQLNDGDVRGDFCDEFDPVYDRVQNFGTIGGNVATFMAQRGRNAADMGIAPESRWLLGMNSLRDSQLTFAYPAHPFVFDFPVTVWDDAQTPDDVQLAAQAFADWLLEPAQQAQLADYGMRPVQGTPAPDAALFADALEMGILLDPPLDTPIQPPAIGAVTSMMGCF